MALPKIKELLAIILVVNVIGLLAIFGFVYHQTESILDDIRNVSQEIQVKLDNTNELLTELNSNIQGLDQLNDRINEINSNVAEIKRGISNLNDVYPNQTVIINNVTQDKLNNAINNAVTVELSSIKWKTNFNFILNIIFGSLLTLGGVFYIYITWKRK